MIYKLQKGRIMKNFIIFTLFLSCLAAKASGCMHYDVWVSVNETSEEKILSESNYTVAIIDNHTVKLEINSPISKTILLKRDNFSMKISQSLKLRDVVFEEGHGCGPVYICTTGQIVLNLPSIDDFRAGQFVYPQLYEYESEYDQNYAKVIWEDLLDPFFFDVKTKSDQKNCRYGNW